MFKSHLILVIFILAVGAGVFMFVGTSILQHVQAVFSLGSSDEAAKKKAPVKPNFDTDALSTKLDAITDNYPNLDIGIAVTDLANDQQFVYGETAPFEAASTTKLLTAVTLLHTIENGKLSLSRTLNGSTVSTLLKEMIEVSDNDAWATLDTTLGYPAIRAYAAEIGVSSYNSKTNTLSTADTALMLQKLYNGELLNKANADLLLGHMAKANNKYIGTALSSAYTVYHKTGYLEDRLLDSAIIKDDANAYVLVIFTKTYTGTYDFIAGKTLLNSITASVNYALANL